MGLLDGPLPAWPGYIIKTEASGSYGSFGGYSFRIPASLKDRVPTG